jgi:oligosaccharide repeat unit polymerase
VIAWRVVTLVLVVLSPFLVSLLRGRRIELLSVPTVFAAMTLVGYLGPLPTVLDETDYFFLRYPASIDSMRQATAHALDVVILSAAAFHLGYYVIGRISRFATMQRAEAGDVVWIPDRLRQFAVVYVLIGLVMFGVAVALIGGPAVLLSGLGDRIRLMAGLNYFFEAIDLVLVAALLWWAYILSTGRSLRSLGLWLGLVGTLLITGLQGSKSVVFVFVVALGVLYHRIRRRIGRMAVLAGAVGLFAGLTMYALVAREYLAVGQFVTLSDASSETLFKIVQHEFSGNFIQLQTLSVLVDQVPDALPYQLGKSFLAFFALPVPRGLWPGKPLPATGIFTLAFWPESWLASGTTLPPGIIGEFYLNFGVAGAVLGMMGFGALLRLAYRFANRTRTPYAEMQYALLVAMLPHYIRGDFSGTVLLLILLIPLATALRFVTRRTTATMSRLQPATALA